MAEAESSAAAAIGANAGQSNLVDAAADVVEDVVQRADALARAVDSRVAAADEPGNRVGADRSRLVRWAGPLFVLCSLVLLPWIVIIAATLPSRELSPNYDIAWAGFDVLLFLALASTGAAALRRSATLAVTAGWASALLITDAWFDVLTSPSGAGRAEAIAMALLVELPLAATCLWLARHTLEITERRISLLLGSHRGRATNPVA